MEERVEYFVEATNGLTGKAVQVNDDGNACHWGDGGTVFESALLADEAGERFLKTARFPEDWTITVYHFEDDTDRQVVDELKTAED